MNENLKSLVELGKNLPSRQEFVRAFSEVIKYVKDIDKRLTGDFNVLAATIRGIAKQVQDDAKKDSKEIDARINKALADLSKAVDAKLATVKDGEKGEDGIDGATPTTEELLALIKPLIPAPIKGDKGDPGEPGPAGVSGRPVVGWGAHPLQVHDSSGSVVDKVTRTLKFTGATVSRSPDGVTTVAVSSSGFTELAPTETPDGSTTVFTFSAATAQPSYVVADNVWLRATSKAGTVNWTWDSGTKKVTMTIPPNDDIYGVA